MTRSTPPKIKPSDRVQEFLRAQIFSGELHPGQWIRLEDLAKSHGVSTTPVREAVAVLVDEGLLEVRTRRGITVRPFSVQDILDNFELFSSITGMMVERSTALLSDEQLDSLGDMVQKMARATKALEQQDNDGSRERRELERLNWEFHRQINSASGSQYLKNVARYVARNIPRDFYMRTDDWPPIAQRGHEELYEAIRRRDAAAARTIAERHILEDAEKLVQYLEREGMFDAQWPDADEEPIA
jgi:DNA-binding GntR family transcriptional regulator